MLYACTQFGLMLSLVSASRLRRRMGFCGAKENAQSDSYEEKMRGKRKVRKLNASCCMGCFTVDYSRTVDETAAQRRGGQTRSGPHPYSVTPSRHPDRSCSAKECECIDDFFLTVNKYVAPTSTDRFELALEQFEEAWLAGQNVRGLSVQDDLWKLLVSLESVRSTPEGTARTLKAFQLPTADGSKHYRLFVYKDFVRRRGVHRPCALTQELDMFLGQEPKPPAPSRRGGRAIRRMASNA